MPYRIIYCAVGCVSLLAQSPHESLRPLGQGVVESLPDESVRELLRKDAATPILYFSQVDYQEAMEGLSDAQADEALQSRLETWSPQALNHALERVARSERRAMSLTAALWQKERGDRTRRLEAHFARGLDLLTAIAGTGRYDRMDVQDLLTAIVEADALLAAQLEDPREVEMRTGFEKTLALALKGLGRPQFSQALPFAEPTRGVWIFPAGDAVMAYVKSRGLNAVAWRGGVVTELTPRAIQRFQQDGSKVQVLYFDAGDLLRDGSPVSQSQLLTRYEALSREDAPEHARRKENYLNQLRLSVAIQRRALHMRAANDTALAAVLAEQVSAERRVLMTEVAQSGSWAGPDDLPATPQRLANAEKEITDDITFLQGVAQQRGDSYLAHRMSDLLNRKTADLKQFVDAN